MFRSRLKRCQPLHPSAAESSLKRGFVAPRQNGDAAKKPSNTVESKKEEMKMESPPAAKEVKKKAFVSPLKAVSSEKEPEGVTDDKYCFSYFFLVMFILA